MIDPQLIRQNLTEVSEKLARRHFSLPQDQLLELEQTRKHCQIETQHLQSERNRLAKTIGQAKAKGENVNDLLNESTAVNEKLAAIETQLISVQDTLNEILLNVPNLPHDSVPIGKTEADNLEIRRWGTPREFAFTPQDHTDIGTKLGLLDFETATKVTGTRFVILRGALARLQRALTQFMLDVHTQEHGYTEVYVPFLVNSDSLLGTGQLPKFAADLFHITEQNYYLIPTAEVPVTNMARETIFDDLPLKMVCHTPCFRSEAGNYGKDTRGMIRQHQFEKVELVQFVKPEDSYTALEELTHHAETILQRLDLPYRVVALCTGDLGFSSAKTYDLEVWLPGQQKYREISSCSNFEAFQARRMKARWRDPNSKKPVLIHTLNGSGLAVGRTLVAIMENYQDWAGRIVIPEILQKYMGGQVHIG